MDYIEKIINEYSVRIKNYYYKKGYRNEELEDLEQESLLEIIKSINKFKNKSSLSTWIYAICQNIHRNNIYQKERLRKTIKRIEILDNKNIKIEDKIDLKIAIESLDKIEKMIFEYYYNEGRKISEIVKILDIPSGTIKYKLYNIRKKLKDQLM